MPVLVCTGAELLCSLGTAPSIFNATPPPRVTTTVGEAGNVADIVPMTNVSPFGMCTSPANPAVAAATAAALGVLTPMPCVPNPSSPWKPGCTSVSMDGLPALDLTCTLTCLWGGVIEVTNPGQALVSGL
ncbi:MAG TPA: DUF4280 domain-containing protein [Bryobacteraceae bacterium]|nr:DUF4280 domain-containing protein [Bryobacteraceae bacterium]